ncbi:TetR/AcrR family transcriptional regulator [Microbispora bryophytorum]|uniref:TetR/AcrR family transcriptional regulator n=1 Tax=Microbispora bryophytorum subsp. camponoti TaxID=1677852 RepID=A0ABR8L8Z8_9ACTN|nr:TetR/AcrR family transcriptional regulator [Microbispora camponoti]MBD3147396.1 TetR/AcrR family transcriptional regulator [Microbispora camponoti]
MGSAVDPVAPHDDTIAPGRALLGGKTGVTDKRLLRGARTRERILRHAVDLASLEGLGNVSFGRLATETGLSKAGIQTLFKSKEALQLATIEYARRLFIDAVIRPTRSAQPGVARLRALLDRWTEYATAPLFAGGCFRAANLADFDSRPGPIRDALFRDQQEWVATIAGELGNAVAEGEVSGLDTQLAAFQIDALLCAANTALRMGDAGVVDKVYRAVNGMLGL